MQTCSDAAMCKATAAQTNVLLSARGLEPEKRKTSGYLDSETSILGGHSSRIRAGIPGTSRRHVQEDNIRIVWLSAVFASGLSHTLGADAVTFERFVAPLPAARRAACHGPHEAESDVRIDLREKAFEGE